MSAAKVDALHWNWKAGGGDPFATLLLQPLDLVLIFALLAMGQLWKVLTHAMDGWKEGGLALAVGDQNSLIYSITLFRAFSCVSAFHHFLYYLLSRFCWRRIGCRATFLKPFPQQIEGKVPGR